MGKKDVYNSRRGVIISRLLFVVYIICVIYFMFFAEEFGRNVANDEYRYNIVPFVEINRFISLMNGKYNFKAILNLLGNIVAFIPFGMFLPAMRTKKTGFINLLIATFVFSSLIEIVQLYTKLGVLDVDDVILNTLGGIIGYLIYTVGKAWKKNGTSKKKI